MRRILSYINSHRYDIHAVFAGFLAVLLMYLIKQPIKNKIRNYVDAKIEANPKLADKRRTYIKHYNMVISLLNKLMILLEFNLTVIIAFCMFFLVSLVSPIIDFSFSSAIMSGVFALCEYAVIDQLGIVHDKGGDEYE